MYCSKYVIRFVYSSNVAICFRLLHGPVLEEESLDVCLVDTHLCLQSIPQLLLNTKEQLDDHIVKPKINDYNIFSDPVLYWSLSLKVVVI